MRKPLILIPEVKTISAPVITSIIKIRIFYHYVTVMLLTKTIGRFMKSYKLKRLKTSYELCNNTYNILKLIQTNNL